MGKELVRRKMIKFVKMEEVHVEEIARLETECFSDPWSVHSISSELNNPLSLWIVALKDEEVVGYIGSQSVMGEADMMNLAVAPEFRRLKIGQSLVSELIERLKENSVSSITLEVRVSNESAICLYNKMGFLQVGRRPRYYTNPREDALILRKEWEV